MSVNIWQLMLLIPAARFSSVHAAAALTASHPVNHSHIQTTLGTLAPNVIIKRLLHSLLTPNPTPCQQTHTHTHVVFRHKCIGNDSVTFCTLSYYLQNGKTVTVKVMMWHLKACILLLSALVNLHLCLEFQFTLTWLWLHTILYNILYY